MTFIHVMIHRGGEDVPYKMYASDTVPESLKVEGSPNSRVNYGRGGRSPRLCEYGVIIEPNLPIHALHPVSLRQLLDLN